MNIMDIWRHLDGREIHGLNRSPGAMSIRSMSKWNRFLGRSEEQPMDQWTGRSSVFLTRAMFVHVSTCSK